MNDCLHCLTPTENAKFCSRSCSVSYNNRLSPKRKPEHFCKSCQIPINRNRKYCNNCSWMNVDLTLEQVIDKYKKHHRSSAYALIRTRARRIAEILGWNQCLICGYKKHIEICHKKAISEFPLPTLISEINSEINLAPLCPNCHWEFDNGLLQLPHQHYPTRNRT